MSKLKSKIRQTEIELEANSRYIQRQLKALQKHPQTTGILSTALIAGFATGFILARYMKVRWVTMVSVPMKVNNYVTAAKMFIEQIKR